ncbi:MAG: hypothetical protein WAL04_09600 [Acidimicrobiales bacterium]|jgi:hypothetical protein
MAAFDAKKLSPVDWGVAGAGALALIALFFPWYGVSAGVFSASVSGWSTSYGWLGALLIVAAGAYLVLQRSDVQIKLPIGPAVVVLGAATLGALIVILRWLTLPSGGSIGGVYSYGPRIGIYLTLIAGVVQAGCAFKLFRASGEALPWAGQGSAGAGGTQVPGTSTPGPAFGTSAPAPDYTASAPAPDYSMPTPQDFGTPSAAPDYGTPASAPDSTPDEGIPPTV